MLLKSARAHADTYACCVACQHAAPCTLSLRTSATLVYSLLDCQGTWKMRFDGLTMQGRQAGNVRQAADPAAATAGGVPVLGKV